MSVMQYLLEENFQKMGEEKASGQCRVCQNGKGRLGKSYSVGKWNNVLSVSRGIDFKLQCIKLVFVFSFWETYIMA